MTIRTALLAASAIAGAALTATPAAATVTLYTVSGTFENGSVLGGSFTYDDSVTNGSTGFVPGGYGNITLTLNGALPTNTQFSSATFNNGVRGAKGQQVQFFYDNTSGSSNFIKLSFDTTSGADFARGILSSGNVVGSLKDTVAGDRVYTLNSGATATAAPFAATTAVPEPASWALMIAGFGLTGAALRRRQRTRVAFA